MDATAQHLMAQLRQNPLDPNLLEELRRHCERVRDPATWADALEHHARAAGAADADPIELGRLHYELGNLYRDQLGRSDRAIAHYRTAIDFDAAQRPAMAAARAIFSDAGKWDQVAKLLSREAESLPRGPKRMALLRERAGVLTKRLSNLPAAVEALREAETMAREDLDLKHELATVLLDLADRATDRDEARRTREEAAEILCGMARNVGDDYAFAYVEAALDAVPDHEPSLRLLQQIAPRLGRADSIPARWVASLQHAPEGPLSRELRLKLAIAYRTAGQSEDARVCLQPLIERGDEEAIALANELKPRSKAPSKRPSTKPGAERASERPAKKSERPKGHKSDRVKTKKESSRPVAQSKPPEPPEAPSASKEVADQTNRTPLFSELSLIEDEPSQAAKELSSALSELRASEPEAEAEASTPLDDLASLAARDSSRDLADRTIVEDSPLLRESGADPSSAAEPKTDERPNLRSSEQARASARDQHYDPEREELTTSGVEELRKLIDADVKSQDDDEPTQVPGGLSRDTPDETPAHALAEPLTSPGVETDSGTMDLDSGSFESSDDPIPDTQIEAATVDDAEEFDPNAGRAQTQAAEAAEPTDLPDETTRPRADGGRTSRAPEAVPMGSLSEPKTARGARPERASSRPPPEDISEEPEDELTTLRRELRRRLRFRDRRGAAELAERMLAMGTLDADAISALEDQYRMTRDFRRMRDLAMRIASELEIPVEQRLARLREAAMLSESKLGDVDGTVHAWREVLALVPTDDEANNKLRRLLTRLARWDDLAQLLTQRAEADPEPHTRADRYREIATLHRDRRKSVDDAIRALELARALDPEHASDLALLCELYVAAGKPKEAAQAFEQRIEHTVEPVERVPLLVTLADLYEHELNDLDAAYRTGEALLLIAPRHLASLDRLLRIDERLNRWDNVVRVLESKLSLGDAAARAKLYARVGEIALRNLNDASRAASAYAHALDITPDDRALINVASEAYDQAGRRDELTESIGTAAQHARDATKRFDLYQLVAERREADGDLSAAIAAREAQLAVRRDPGILALLVALLRRTDRANDLVRRLDELARSSEPRVARELRLERAAVLAEQLSNLEAAKGELARVLEELSPDDVQILEMLIDLCRRTDDVARRTEAQERLIRLAPSLEARIDLAADLVDTFERIQDREGEMRILRVWIGFEPQNPQPYLRLVPLLEQSGLREELLSTSDALARLAMGEEEVGEYLLRGARVALDLGDYDGAWQRLVPRVVDAGDKAAEELLKQVAEKGGRAEALAELYVGLAQREESGPRGGPQSVRTGTRRWLDAAHTYEHLAGSYDKALEAVLRAFARNLDDAALWSEADRLAELAHAWPRLSQVYDTLVRRAETPLARANILMRHAKLLEERAHDSALALTRASLAFQVDPVYEPAYAEATRLARVSSAHEALIDLYERRALASIPIDAQLTALLEASRTAFVALDDALRATSYLARGVLLARGDAALLDRIEAHAAELDEENPPPTGQGLVHALSEVYAREAHEGGHTVDLAILLWTRAASLRDRALGDLPGAYGAREQASLRKPADEALLDALIEVATRANMLEDLARHLSQRAERAIDSSTSIAALTRLGALYEGPLASHDLAAETFAQLVKLNPRDPAAFSRLRGALKAGNKHKELLLAIERQLLLATDRGARLALLKEAAEVWERDLKNRFEARDAWRRVSTLAPEDKDAEEAIARLRTRPVFDDLSLLDGDLVVSAEDLLPTVPPEPAPEPPPAEVSAPAGDDADDGQDPAATDAVSLSRGSADFDPEAQSAEPDATYGEAAADAANEDEPAFHAARGADDESSAESDDFPTSADASVAGAEVLASLTDKVSAFSEPPEDDGERLSELERAAFEASHAHDDEQPEEPDERGSEEGQALAPTSPADDDQDSDPTLALASAPDSDAAHGPPAGDESPAEPPGEPRPDEDWRTADASMFDTVDVPVDQADEIEVEHHDEPSAPGTLDTLDSMLSGTNTPRAASTSRIPPPPPVGRASTPAPAGSRKGASNPPKSARPPPPPRRD
jgi:Tetratricopeptide repeat